MAFHLAGQNNSLKLKLTKLWDEDGYPFMWAERESEKRGTDSGQSLLCLKSETENEMKISKHETSLAPHISR